jgi:hypothetical protein
MYPVSTRQLEGQDSRRSLPSPTIGGGNDNLFEANFALCPLPFAL